MSKPFTRLLLSFSVFLLSFFIILQSSAQAAKHKNGYANNPYTRHKKETGFKSAMNTTGNALSATGEGIWKGFYWTGKGVYETGKFITTELVRPFVPIRNKMVDSFGVEVKES